MIKHNQNGAISGLMVSFILVLVVLAGALGFGAWAFMGRQDYKDNADAKIKTAEAAATQKESAAKDAEFAEAIKKPFKLYNGPASYGSLAVEYPKTWSGYVDDTGKGSALVDGYFAPGVVPPVSDQNSIYSLRFQVLSQPYAQTLQNLAGQQQGGKLTIKAYSLPKLPNIVGVMATGELSDQTNVTMVILPLRSQTLQIWTEGSQYLSDFNNSILPNFSFSP